MPDVNAAELWQGRVFEACPAFMSSSQLPDCVLLPLQEADRIHRGVCR